MQLPVIPHPHQLELRAYSMEPHGISSKLLQCKQGHDAYPDSGAGTIKIQDGWRADVSWSSLLVPLSLPPSNDQGLAHGICGWTDGCGLTHRHGCCPAVLLPCQSQCSSHEAVPVASPSHSSHPLPTSRLSQNGLKPEASPRLHLPPPDARVKTKSLTLITDCTSISQSLSEIAA